MAISHHHWGRGNSKFLWVGVAAALTVSLVVAGGLSWRYSAPWPGLLLAVILASAVLYVLGTLRVVAAQRRALLKALEERTRACEAQATRLDAICKVAGALSEPAELTQLLERGLERGVSALGLDSGQVHLNSEDEDQVMYLIATFAKAGKPRVEEQTVRVAECICGQAAAEGRPVVVEDVTRDPRIVGRACAGAGVGSVASVPLRMGGRSHGVLTVHSSDPRRFAPQDVELLTVIANLLAAAIENVSARSQMEGQIAKLSADLQQLAIVEERDRIGREMHDGLAQTLGLLNVQLEMVKWAAKTRDWAAAEDELARLDSYLSSAYDDVREALSNLRHTEPKGEQFIATLRDYVDGFGRRNSLEAVLVTEKGEGPVCLPPLVEVHLQRVIQEALTNVRRHAAASRVEVQVSQNHEGLQVIIADDGIGFDLDSVGAGQDGSFGLATMKERVESLGGRFAIASHPGDGTRVAVCVPCASNG